MILTKREMAIAGYVLALCIQTYVSHVYWQGGGTTVVLNAYFRHSTIVVDLGLALIGIANLLIWPLEPKQ
ncbi:MAG: hypothetical protein Q7S47_01260 [bacterium]|nr:hypothetical protein [bacterium]